ncbi:MAG: asparagine synthetase B [Hyphomonadaceae bacterium]
MLSRIAGVVSTRPEAVAEFLRATSERFRMFPPGTFKIIAFPTDQPVVGIVVAEARRPEIRCWCAPDGSFVVLDGEIYDFGDGVSMESPGAISDAELEHLFQLHRKKGDAGMARVDAAAAMIFWDAAQRELRLYRDASGVVTTFYATQDGNLTFSSEMETLLASGVDRRVDRNTVDYYLSKGYAPAPWTFIEGVRKIPPGHMLSCRPGVATTIARYYRQATRPKMRIGREERNERIRALMTQSLRRRVEPSSTTSVLVSGGIDSMLVVGSLVKLVGAPAQAFTFRYADYEGHFNEEGPARKLAEHLGIKHETIGYGPTDIAEGLPKILKEYGEPLAWGLHSFMLRSMARPDIDVILTGTEPEWNLRSLDRTAIRFRSLPGAARSLARAAWPVARSVLPKYDRAATAIFRTERSGIPPQFVHSSILGETLRQEIYMEPRWASAGAQASERLFKAALEELADEDPYDQARLLDDRFLNSEGSLFWTSIWQRSYNLRIRHPYCDRDMRDFFYLLPAAESAKQHLRDFASTFLPPEVANAPKSPQEIPIGHWFRGPLRDLVRDRLSPQNLPADLFQPAVVQRLVKEHLDGTADNSWRLWSLISLTTWIHMGGA